MTTAEQLALAALKGDTDAIGPLLDCLTETMATRNYVAPLKVLNCDRKNIRALVYISPIDLISEEENERIRNGVERWIDGEEKILTFYDGIMWVELYELKDGK